MRHRPLGESSVYLANYSAGRKALDRQEQMSWKKSLSLIVVTHNSSRLMRPFCKALPWSYVEKAVFVDSGSDVEEAGATREATLQVPQAVWHAHPQNVGFGAGANLGFGLLEPSDDDLILIINPDFEANEDLIQGSIQAVELNLGDIVSPKIVTLDSRGRTKTWYRSAVLWKGLGILNMRPLIPEIRRRLGGHDVTSTTIVSGAFMLMKAKTFRDLGGFREDFFMYWEDVDFCRRAQDQGFSLAYLSNQTGLHYVGQSSSNSAKKSNIYFFFFHRNRVRLMREVTPGWKPWQGMGMLGTLALLANCLLTAKSPLYGLRESLRGIRTGLRG